MKIELKMSDDTEITIEDQDEGIDVEFARWSYNQTIKEAHERDYSKNRFLVQFKTTQDVSNFLEALTFIMKGLYNG